VRLLRSRPADELQHVYREHVRAVYAFFAYSVTRPVAEDLTSETFERVIRAWGRYDAGRGSERTWILSIARNLLIDHYRRSNHRDAVSTDEHPVLLEGLVAGEEAFERTLDADELRAWLSHLGERERQILALRYAADLQAADIAELVGLSPANVHQILSRSLRRLRETAEGSGVTSSA
jgi:RNA polymerase sigma factor (sigma-70 family)